MSLFVTEGALRENGVDQKNINQAHCVAINPQWQEGVDIDTPHFDVFNATPSQRDHRRFTGLGHAFGPDGAVKFVFYLQQCFVELCLFAVVGELIVAVLGVRRHNRFGEGGQVVIQVVVADIQARLGVAGVTQVPHTK